MNTNNVPLSYQSTIVSALCMLALSLFLGCQGYTTGLQKSRTATDETAVVATLQTVAKAQLSYAVNSGGDFGTFLQLTEQGFLDSRFASEKPKVRGYVLTMTTGDRKFSCNADPDDGASGKHFYLDSESVLIRVHPSRPATASDPVYQQ